MILLLTLATARIIGITLFAIFCLYLFWLFRSMFKQTFVRFDKVKKLEEDYKEFIKQMEGVQSSFELKALLEKSLKSLNDRSNEFEDHMLVHCLSFKAMGMAEGMLNIFNKLSTTASKWHMPMISHGSDICMVCGKNVKDHEKEMPKTN